MDEKSDDILKISVEAKFAELWKVYIVKWENVSFEIQAFKVELSFFLVLFNFKTYKTEFLNSKFHSEFDGAFVVYLQLQFY